MNAKRVCGRVAGDVMPRREMIELYMAEKGCNLTTAKKDFDCFEEAFMKCFITKYKIVKIGIFKIRRHKPMNMHGTGFRKKDGTVYIKPFKYKMFIGELAERDFIKHVADFLEKEGVHPYE